jgi:phospholipid/cholesterol/gamma-HCH transport system ATP-binding protein
VIEARALCVSQGGQPVLGPISGEFGQGTLVIAGPSHSGKTTLLKALCGLLRPDQGSVWVDGSDLASGRAVRVEAQSRMGVVFQSDALFDSMDALANVDLPLLRRGVARAEAERRSREALEQVGLLGQEHAWPERLSGGMRKRLGLARAIVAKPDYLLADDPLAGLDPGTGERINELLFTFSHTRAGLIVATADPEPFRNRCDEVLFLDQGRVVARGPSSVVRVEEAS